MTCSTFLVTIIFYLIASTFVTTYTTTDRQTYLNRDKWLNAYYKNKVFTIKLISIVTTIVTRITVIITMETVIRKLFSLVLWFNTKKNQNVDVTLVTA